MTRFRVRVCFYTQSMTLTVGSLFSGIGGIDLGLERAGMTVRWQSEIDPYACKVLQKHWPDIPNLGDIKTVDWSTIEPVDVIAGGYPCQPFSTAGKRKGENDPRHLWPNFRDAISAIRPRYALLENVRGHLSMGFNRVLADLTALGYDTEWRIVSAASVGAPHRRDRIICVAYPHDSGSRTPTSRIDSDGQAQVKEWQQSQPQLGRLSEVVADADGRRLKERDTQKRRVSVFDSHSARGIGDQWKTEPNVGRVVDGVPARVDRLRGLGNAVVPQVAEYVGRLILDSLN